MLARIGASMSYGERYLYGHTLRSTYSCPELKRADIGLMRLRDHIEASEEASMRASVPGPGRSIWLGVADWTEHLLCAFAEMISNVPRGVDRTNIVDAYRQTYSPLLVQRSQTLAQEDELALAASALLSVWMLFCRTS